MYILYFVKANIFLKKIEINYYVDNHLEQNICLSEKINNIFPLLYELPKVECRGSHRFSIGIKGSGLWSNRMGL